MNTSLAKAILDLNVPQFGRSRKNKGDSPSCRFEPRNLLSCPKVLDSIGRAIAKIASTKCRGSALAGLATSGIAWAAVASLYSDLPLLYVRKTPERLVGNKLLEGIAPEDRTLILIDDLIFAGESKRKALRLLAREGYSVKDIIVIIDRQLQRVDDGPRIQDEFGVRLHSLITMSQIVAYMKMKHAITHRQLQDLAADYRLFPRWDMPDFIHDMRPDYPLI